MSDCVPKTSLQSPAASLLALEDGCVEETMAEGAAPVGHAGIATLALPSGEVGDQGAECVQATLAALKGAVDTQVPKEPKRRAWKKPAASASLSSEKEKVAAKPMVFKKPASRAKESKPPKATESKPPKPTAKRGPVKKPAASKQVKKDKTKETRAEKRLRLLGTLPANARRRYKGGCSKCRYQAFCTLSCWRQRGFNLR